MAFTKSAFGTPARLAGGALKRAKGTFVRAILWGSFIAVPMTGVASIVVSNPYAGMTRYSAKNENINGRSVDYEVIVINTLDAGISFYLTPDNGVASHETRLQTTKNFASAHVTEVAINAHFFDTSLSPDTNNTGIAASNGTVYSPFETNGGFHALNITQDNFPETVTGVSGGTTFATSPTAPYTTISPGSMLIRDGAVLNIGSEDFRARSQIGVSRDGVQIMLFASSDGITEQEGAAILVNQYGAFNVHGLDGGGSTTLVLRTAATTQTVIAKEGVSERAVGTNLGVQAAPYVGGIPDAMTWDADPVTPGIQQGAGLWDVTTPNWQAAGVNRIWANPKTPTLGAGGGSLITLGNRIGVNDMTVDGGYIIGMAGGPTFTILGNFTTGGHAATTINAPLGTSSTFTKKGEQSLILGSSARISRLTLAEGEIDLSGQTITLIDPLVPLTLQGGSIKNGSLQITDSAPDFAVPSGNTTISANLTIPRITKSGAGAVYLTGSNSWTGALIVSEGTLGFGPSSTVPSTAMTLKAGMIDLNGAMASIKTLAMGGTAAASSMVSTGSGLLTLGGTLTYDSTNQPLGATISGNLGLGGTRTFAVGDSSAAGDDLTVTANVTGAFALTKNGTGTLVLSGNNTFTSFKNSSGATRSGNPEALGTTTLTIDSGLVDLNGFNENVTALTMGGVASQDSELRTGMGVLGLNGNFSFSATNNGLQAVISGFLDMGAATRTFTIANSTGADPDIRIAAAVSGHAGLTKSGNGRMELAGPLDIPGNFTVNNGEVLLSGGDRTLAAVTLGGSANATATLDTGTTTLAITSILAHSSSNNNLGAFLRGRVDLGNALKTFTINDSTNAAVDMRIEAELTGSGGFTKGGTGTLELAGPNTLSGPISATAGILRLAHASALGNAPTLAVNGTASIDLGGLADRTLLINRGSLTVSGNRTLTGNVDLSNGKLVCPGTGVLQVTGDVDISGGTLEVKVGAGAGTLGANGVVTLGGNLEVKMGGTSLNGTQSIPIITAASITGNFNVVHLPTPPLGTIYSIVVTPTQVLFQVAPGTPAQAWLLASGLSASMAMDQDTDGDGFVLLSEYALGGSASWRDNYLMQGNYAGGFLHLGFFRNPSATDVTYLVEGSSNLTTWATVLRKIGSGAWTGNAPFSEGTLSMGLVPVTVTDTTSTSPRFLRIRVTQP